MDPSNDGKEGVLVLTDVFFKFSQTFVTSNQKALTVAKTKVDQCVYIYGIPAHIYGDKGLSFDKEILEHLYTLYGVKQSTTMPYHPCKNPTCERLNCMLHDLLRTFD